MSHAMDISRITTVILKNCQKIEKMTPLTIKKFKRHTDRQTTRQTDTKVNTEDTLSGFQEFFLQTIIKDRSK